MTEKPIQLAAPSVIALLQGRKTVARQAVKFRGPWARFDYPHAAPHPVSGWVFADFELTPDRVAQIADPDGGMKCPLGSPGDKLWVRETWGGDATRGLGYRADHPDWVRYQGNGENSPWHPSSNMPRWASRINLEVLEVRVERLHAITEEDAVAEGAIFTDYGKHDFSGGVPGATLVQRRGWSMEPTTSADQCLLDARHAFANLWDKTEGKRRPWDQNPWVWRVRFRRLP